MTKQMQRTTDPELAAVDEAEQIMAGNKLVTGRCMRATTNGNNTTQQPGLVLPRIPEKRF